MDKIKEAQKEDRVMAEIRKNLSEGKAKGFREDENCTVWYKDCICVPENDNLKKLILQEADDSPYSILS